MEIPSQLKNAYNWIQMVAVITLSVGVAWFVVRTYTQKLSRGAILARLLALDLVVIGVCVGVDSLLDSRYPMIFAIVATGILTFYGMLLHFVGRASDVRLADSDTRMAIASSITAMYLILVGYGVFISGEDGMSPLAENLMDSFSSVVGVVIAFYFGSSAYLEARRTTTSGQNSASQEPRNKAASGT
jgi:hypothetical protein